MSKRIGKLDKQTRTVTVNFEEAGYDDVRRLANWLRRVERWMRWRNEQDNGGRRWVFSHDPPEAHFLAGKTATAHVRLVRVTPRKAATCESCDEAIAPGSRAWKQKPKSWGGHAKSRWCNRCFENKRACEPPKLVVLDGGAA